MWMGGLMPGIIRPAVMASGNCRYIWSMPQSALSSKVCSHSLVTGYTHGQVILAGLRQPME